jgi:hypothetical protein
MLNARRFFAEDELRDFANAGISSRLDSSTSRVMPSKWLTLSSSW